MTKTLAYYPGCSLHGTSGEFDASFKATRPGARPGAPGDPGLGVLRQHRGALHQPPAQRGAAGQRARQGRAGHEARRGGRARAPPATAASRPAPTRSPRASRRRPTCVPWSAAPTTAASPSTTSSTSTTTPWASRRSTPRSSSRSPASRSPATTAACSRGRRRSRWPTTPSTRRTWTRSSRPSAASRWTGTTRPTAAAPRWRSPSRASSTTSSAASSPTPRRAAREAVIVACPLCQVNLDGRQVEITKKDAGWQGIPVVFLSQLVGRAIGLDDKTLGLKKHLVDIMAVMA